MQITRETIAGLLERSVCAPSGDNCQPWRFTVDGNTVLVHNVPERDTSLYSWGQRSSYVAHGALLETIAVAAGAAGLAADIVPLPDGPDGPVAKVSLSLSAPVAHPLDGAIEKRTTNRRPYAATPLMPQQWNALVGAGGAPVTIMLTEDASIRARLARAAALNEKVLFENERMHRFFFSHLQWKPSGQPAAAMSVATLELPPPVRAIFPAIGRWPVMRVLASVGFANGIVHANTATYSSGAATAAFVLPNRSPLAFIQCGRSLQRFWLTATTHGLSMQVLSGIGFLMNRVAAGEPGLSQRHEAIVRGAYQEMTDALDIRNDVVALMARVGHAPDPSARTPRLAPDITW